MKKHKSVVAILLAVMMIFTFMPTMAFATGQQSATSWAEKVATMTDKDGDTFNTVRTFDSDGLIEAVGQNNKTVVPETVAPSDGVFFVDFDSSMLTFNGGTKLDGTTWKQANFNGRGLELTLVQPDYAAGYDAKKPLTKSYPLTKGATDPDTGVTKWTATINNWDVTVEESKYEKDLETEQSVTYTVTKKAASEVKGTAVAPDAFGKTADAKVTVKGEDRTPATAKIYLDAANKDHFATFSGGALEGLYDGEAHTVVTDTVPGYAVSYEVYDAAAGKYVAATSVSITDVQEAGKEVVFRVVYTDTKTNAPTKTQDITLNLKAAKGAFVGFKLVDPEDGWVYSVAGSDYKATDYIAVEAMNSKPYSDDDKARAAAQAKDAACAKAVAKNEAEIMNYFNELYDVVETVSKYNPDLIDLEIVAKDLTVNEKTAIEKKYGALTNNISVVKPGEGLKYSEINDEAQIFLNGKDPHDYTVEFTKAVDKKVFKGKKFIKKAKLKKNGTIALKAECANGYTVKYKLSNANSKIVINKKTGKITCKKGLAKGTYKVKVTAYVPQFTDTPLARITSETQTVVIKVNKK